MYDAIMKLYINEQVTGEVFVRCRRDLMNVSVMDSESSFV